MLLSRRSCSSAAWANQVASYHSWPRAARSASQNTLGSGRDGSRERDLRVRVEGGAEVRRAGPLGADEQHVPGRVRAPSSRHDETRSDTW